MFTFQHKVDMNRAYQKRSWLIRGGCLILKKWLLNLTWQEIDFSTSLFWAQIHNLLLLWRTKEHILKIGSKIGEVTEVDFMGDNEGT